MRALFLVFALLISNVSYGAFEKTKELASGVSGNYWAVSEMRYSRRTMTVEIVLNLYKDNTVGLAPLGFSKKFNFVITPQELSGNLSQWAHTKILTYADSDVPNLDGNGTHKGFPDLIGATVVP